MEFQKIIVRKYLHLYNHPTLRKMSALTGIQMTRIFRILNGSEMKVSEYFVFLRAIEEKEGRKVGYLNQLSRECEKELNVFEIQELAVQMEKVLKLKRIYGGCKI